MTRRICRGKSNPPLASDSFFCGIAARETVGQCWIRFRIVSLALRVCRCAPPAKLVVEAGATGKVFRRVKIHPFSCCSLHMTVWIISCMNGICLKITRKQHCAHTRRWLGRAPRAIDPITRTGGCILNTQPCRARSQVSRHTETSYKTLLYVQSLPVSIWQEK